MSTDEGGVHRVGFAVSQRFAVCALLSCVLPLATLQFPALSEDISQPHLRRRRPTELRGQKSHISLLSREYTTPLALVLSVMIFQLQHFSPVARFGRKVQACPTFGQRTSRSHHMPRNPHHRAPLLNLNILSTCVMSLGCGSGSRS